MQRGSVIGFVALGALSLTLMVTVAWNGSQLDDVRQERDDLEFEVDDLREEVDTLTLERDDLQKKADEHLKTIEQLKSTSAGASEPAAAPVEAPASTPAAP